MNKQLREKRKPTQSFLAPKIRITLRKACKLSQSELAIMVERGVAIPSVEIAAKIASELKVSLNYLIGLSELIIDNKLLISILKINTLSIEDKQQLYAIIDALLRDYKAKKAYIK